MVADAVKCVEKTCPKTLCSNDKSTTIGALKETVCGLTPLDAIWQQGRRLVQGRQNQSSAPYVEKIFLILVLLGARFTPINASRT